ncbi:MAG TPA: 16S rRNA (cytosine(1402)-N(4))-methyltransferase RsmH [Methylomusa anaerophila]|uniref:Ribosomal RNA small subunit methyltransferase H n=1 Tax=Methylomusa anaerophila TaxID=1930071 RepID=A0A348AQC1_9FIRM|nr:16S rRNA (cytosine(1402)-N(4))-methyltransferase RsmH [Methylomusa anaerophila]BBB93269.1 ribosomal RNA small subunit methyltransferase H [Methylomusa anaerophila]HML86899.1 16S rRNA (cytosine(1402)-N(4))-methyltransferase RsmH [Methylomusa anaerophila]
METNNQFGHTSVLLKETVDAVLTDPEGIYIDCTLGGAGHSFYLAQHLSRKGWLIGIDQDPAAICAGRDHLKDAICRVSIVRDNFSNLDNILCRLNIEEVNGILFDLGVSSHQLDVAERGFSYMQDAPLDMRMNPDAEMSAYDVVNFYSEPQLTRLIADYGEERWAKRIARFIVDSRNTQKIDTTGRLVDIIKKAIPAGARREGPHPAKRTFQAIRIEVNNELGILCDAFITAVNCLKTGGRVAIITFHSLEDRIAKRTLQEMAKSCVCPPQLPICVCNNKPKVKILGKAIIPSAEELKQNPRARSAKLRVAEKL